MRHRLYYMLPDIPGARQVLDDLLLNRIEHRYIHFLTDGTQLSADMQEANFLQKTDVVHGAKNGMLIGAALGALLGVALVMDPFYAAASKASIILIPALAGLLFGGWASSMAAAALPNSDFKLFYPDIEQGKVLMIVDVPSQRVGQIEQLLSERHPEIKFGGEESRIPAFP